MDGSTPERTACCIAGGGPAGMVLALLLARAGVPVVVLEKHADFLRDFRGDTVHASTLTLLDELGLGERFAAMPHRTLERLQQSSGLMLDFRALPGPHKHIAMAPQWDFLDLLASAGRQEPTFSLRMGAEVTGLLREHGRVTGVRYRTPDGTEATLHATLTVACDGRSSVLRADSGLRVREFGVPLDVLWFRLSRRETDFEGARVRMRGGAIGVTIDRGGYFQLGYVIRKGSDARLRAEGLDAFRKRVARLAPELADRVGELRSWDDVRLLSVRLNRLARWSRPGLLCIGDAAHAMSPVGGVGLNLAVQDAVATARYLAEPLRRGDVRGRHLVHLQLRRWAPTVVTQLIQRAAHRFAIEPGLAGSSARFTRPLLRLPRLGTALGYLMAIGVRPEHAPHYARRSPF